LRELRDRIKLLMELTGTNQTQFGKAVDLVPSYISEILNGNKKSLSMKSARRISSRLDIDLEWLDEGKGKPPEAITLPSKGKGQDKPLSTIEVLTMAGVGNTHDEENHKPIELIEIPTDQVTIDGKILTKAVKAEGDSMYPTIVDKGLVGVDFEDKNIINNGIYLIMFPDLGIAIKRLQLRTTGLLVESDNKQVQSEEVDKSILEQGFVLGRVRWIHNKV